MNTRIDNLTRQKLEQLFAMSSGYVLDFSNASFADFVRTCLGFDPYDRYSGSKAVILRSIWQLEPVPEVARLNLEILERWRLGKFANNETLTPFEEEAYADLQSKFGQQTEVASAADVEFLARDFGDIDLQALPQELTSEKVVLARLREIDQCLEAEAPLAVIFLVGSTLEGLLMEMAMAHPVDYVSSDSAPKKGGQPKPLQTWTLAELIAVSRVLEIVGEDVSRFADHARSFRNYIHPRQQLQANFEPRMMTARIAHQVLHAALADLQRLVRPTSSD